MDNTQLDLFLASLSSDVPKYMRDVLHRTHTGLAPHWRALSLRRVGDAIVEVAEDLTSERRPKERYAVIKW